LGGTEVLKVTTGILTSFTGFFGPRYTLSEVFCGFLIKSDISIRIIVLASVKTQNFQAGKMK
jgi:hypothetical protein